MSTRKNLQSRMRRQVTKTLKKYRRQYRMVGRLAIIGIAAVGIGAAVFQICGHMNKKNVYAASKEGVVSFQDSAVPTGLAGVISGVIVTETPDGPVNRIGTSFEEVMVGQRTAKPGKGIPSFDMSSSMEAAVDTMNEESIAKAQSAKLMSDTDYGTLLQIVEAEAGGEDVKGRVLVANVIMNRVKSTQFPNTVTEVVWDTSGGAPQFSPTYDGRISTVTVSDETREAVKQAMEGTDYSQGALFFVAKDQAEKRNVAWFDSDLKHLFEYGVHDFYTFPDTELAKLSD
ncbi:MAG: cell wall hydrolase [Blautia sp.]|jgi:N-acetylmuramoyl-L-alanine amidase